MMNYLEKDYGNRDNRERIQIRKKEKYDAAFIETIKVENGKLETLEYNALPTWDSVGHMGLIAVFEEKFERMMEMDDIIDFSYLW